MEFKMNSASKSFVEQVHRLIEAGTVANYKEIADSIGWDKTAVSNVVNSRRNIPLDKYKKFTNVYNVPQAGELGYRDKYYRLLEERLSEQDKVESYMREVATRIKQLEDTHRQLVVSSTKLQHDLRVQSAMTMAYQEWMLEQVGGGSSRKAMTAIRNKAVLLLTSFETKGIGVDMGIVAAGK